MLDQLALVGFRETALQTSSTSSTSQVVTGADIVLFIVAAVLFVVLIGVGVTTKRPRLLSLGIIGVGAVTFATPLYYFVMEAIRLGGLLNVSIQDLVVLSVLAAVGGGIITLGLMRIVGGFCTHQPLSRKPVET